MKATFKSSYRKGSNLIAVYTVTGLAAELAAYAEAKSQNTGVPVDQLVKSENGQHLWHRSTNAAMGITADKQYTLIITPNGKIIPDDSQKQLDIVAEDAVAIRNARNTEIGQSQAKMQLGLISGGSSAIGTGTGNVKTTVVKEEPADEGADEFEKEKAQLTGAGAEKLEEAGA